MGKKPKAKPKNKASKKGKIIGTVAPVKTFDLSEVEVLRLKNVQLEIGQIERAHDALQNQKRDIIQKIYKDHKAPDDASYNIDLAKGVATLVEKPKEE